MTLFSNQGEPKPQAKETPAEYASGLAIRFAADVSVECRRKLAQFFTPLDVARFMAMLAQPTRATQQLLDPSAGTGILACALCEALPVGSGPFHLDAYEVDPALAQICNTALAYAKRWLTRREIVFSFTVHQADYIIANATALTPGLFDNAKPGVYDVALANPPYFKLQKLDPRAVAASAIVHGQPNIYALFMAITASLLKEGGVMVTITPRSFTTGDYFRRFRQHLFFTVVPEAVHLFHSRKEAFRSDAVLQENVILHARRGTPSPSATVTVSTSKGAADLQHRKVREVPVASIVDPRSRDAIFNIPMGEADDAVISFVRRWPNTLHSLGLQVSTGPVVAFRARNLLLHGPTLGKLVAPLLWLQNVRWMNVQWPVSECKKPQYMLDTEDSQQLLVQNGTYVVLRRFTAKEEHRRLTAAPLFSGELPGRMIGLENHLNYVHRPYGQMEDDGAAGLAALLGSALLDRYFRVSNGNTQVNAAELRTLPLPPLRSLMTIGAEVRLQSLDPNEIEEAVADVLHIPSALREIIEAESNGES